MTLELPKEFILYDTEYTSWADDRLKIPREPWQHKEIIQIGALHVVDLEEKASFEVIVKPVKNPKLSDFIIELTGISQIQVDTGTTLTQALTEFSAFAKNLPLYAYGEDANVIKANCDLLSVPFPFSMERCNNLRPTMKVILEERGIDYFAYSSGTLIEAFGKKGEHAHDALNDMRNLLEVIKLLA